MVIIKIKIILIFANLINHNTVNNNLNQIHEVVLKEQDSRLSLFPKRKKLFVF